MPAAAASHREGLRTIPDQEPDPPTGGTVELGPVVEEVARVVSERPPLSVMLVMLVMLVVLGRLALGGHLRSEAPYLRK